MDATKAKQLVAAHRVKDAIKPILSQIEKAANAGQESIVVSERQMPNFGDKHLKELGFEVATLWEEGDYHQQRVNERFVISWS